MFGSLWGKKKEPTILGGRSNDVPGMPSGLYSSKDVENLRFHDKRRVWYDAKQVDDALDVVQATLEWWESKYGVKPGSGTEPADKGSDSSVEAGSGAPLSIDVDHLAGRDEADSEPVPGEQVQSDVERAVDAAPDEHEVDAAPEEPQLDPVAEPADERAEATPPADSAGETTEVIEAPDGGPDSGTASTDAVSPAVAAGPGEHESEFTAVRAKPTVKPAPTFDLNTIAPYMVVGAGKAVDGVVRIGDPAREKKPLEDPAEPASEADSVEAADDGETAHAAPAIKVPEVPPVPVIPTNPFLRRG